jgi:heme o synthase
MMRLFRLRLSLLNGITAVGGYLLFPAPLAAGPMLALFFGVSLLAAGGTALNQVLERDLDGLMARTRCRPLPQGLLSPATAAAMGFGCILAGLLALAVAGGVLPALLGILALVWYLAVYTPLKRRSPLALLLGGVSGSLPPMIGYCLAGGSPADYRVVILAGLLYLWQVPHFWLLQQRHADDYRRAGIPLCGDVTILRRPWLASLAMGSLLLAAPGVGGGSILLCCAALLLLLACLPGRAPCLLAACHSAFPLLVTLALALGQR